MNAEDSRDGRFCGQAGRVFEPSCDPDTQTIRRNVDRHCCDRERRYGSRSNLSSLLARKAELVIGPLRPHDEEPTAGGRESRPDLAFDLRIEVREQNNRPTPVSLVDPNPGKPRQRANIRQEGGLEVGFEGHSSVQVQRCLLGSGKRDPPPNRPDVGSTLKFGKGPVVNRKSKCLSILNSTLGPTPVMPKRNLRGRLLDAEDHDPDKEDAQQRGCRLSPPCSAHVAPNAQWRRVGAGRRQVPTT